MEVLMTQPLSMIACFSELEDPRIDRTKLHSLVDIVCLSVFAVIAGAEGWEDIELFGKQKEHWLKKYLRLPNGIPSHDTISRVFRMLKPEGFQEAFMNWVESLHEQLGLKLIAIDGKTMRRSHDKKTMKAALHVVSAWSVENHISLGQQSVDAKSNEITAIPELLQILELKGAIITIDAMGCQKNIAKQIRTGGGDYVLAVKDNQPTLRRAIDEYFLNVQVGTIQDSRVRQHTTSDNSHGRKTVRYYSIAPLPDSLSHLRKYWPGLRSIGQVVTVTERDGKETSEVRYYITSLEPKVKQFASAVRGHWGIENSLHWVLDVTFNEDQSRIRKDFGPDNFTLLRRFAITIIKQDKSRGSIRSKRKRAAWNNQALENILRLTT